jgi:predicted hotdog family 3-hydroxylacyl-ACP dehydratase
MPPGTRAEFERRLPHRGAMRVLGSVDSHDEARVEGRATDTLAATP